MSVMSERIVMAMSGGVDSSVAAALLKDAGYDVFGVFIKAWEDTSDISAACPWEEDQKMVGEVCTALGIPWETWNFEQEYREHVLEYFFREYENGRTPNPDVLCNKEIKFGIFLDRAVKEGFTRMATGHYARISTDEQGVHLLRGIDANKDQSYFLSQLTQDQLKRTEFPVGEYTKPQIRELAKKYRLPNAQRKDSQGICFIGNISLRNFLKQRIVQNPGRIVTTDGKDVGGHEGLAHYTIGQRKGIGIGGGEPWYIVRKDIKQNTVVVAKGADEQLYARNLHVTHAHWIGIIPPLPVACTAKIRYRQPDQKCTVRAAENGIDVLFENSQRAMTPGQSLVLYSGDEVFGGGVIEHAWQ